MMQGIERLAQDLSSAQASGQGKQHLDLLRQMRCTNLACAVGAMLPAGQQRQLRPRQQVLHNDQTLLTQ